MDNRRIDAQVSDGNKEISEINRILKSIYKDNIYHGVIGLSPIRGECTFWGECTLEIFGNIANAYPTRPAVILQNKEYNYENLDSDANNISWSDYTGKLLSHDEKEVVLKINNGNVEALRWRVDFPLEKRLR